MINAVDDKIVVVLMKKTKTKGGLVIPDSAVNEPQLYGKVLSLGENVKGISIGNVIMFHPRGGMAITMNGKVMNVVKYSEIYGVVTDEECLNQLEEQNLGV